MHAPESGSETSRESSHLLQAAKSQTQVHVENTGRTSPCAAAGQTYLDYTKVRSSHRRITMLVAYICRHQ